MVRSEKGQATVELALSLTIFVFILFAIIDFGRIFHVYLTLDHLSREGARSASVGKSNIEIIQLVEDIGSALDTEEITVNVSPDETNRSRGDYVTVRLTYPISFTIPLFKEFLPETFTIDTETVMRME